MVQFRRRVAYVIAGIGLWALKRWAFWLALAIVIGAFVVFGALGIYIFLGVAWEMRTVIAMTLRTLIWTAIVVVAYREIMQGR